MAMDRGAIPTKTPEGLDELARRTRRLSQRHRTVLLLVDGKRSVQEVVALAAAAGVAESYFHDLAERGLIVVPAAAVESAPALVEPAAAPKSTDLAAGPAADLAADLAADATAADVAQSAAPTEPAAPGDDAPDTAHIDLPIEPDAAAGVRSRPAPLTSRRPPDTRPSTLPELNDSLLPPVRSLLPDSQLSDFGKLDPTAPPPAVDRPLEEAREILIRAVRAEAPVAGQLLLIKLRRAGSRAEIEELLDEVEARIAKPRKMIVAAQTLRHVRHLLGMPTSTSFTML